MSVMRKLFLHVGFAKCGSTSLQAAMSQAPEIVFPQSGNHGGEHLALALTLRGLDDWTRQYFDEDWVTSGQAGLLEEIQNSSGTVMLSSERLAAMSETEIEDVRAMFPDFEIHVILVRRDLTRYHSSTWRHAVFRHDYAEPYETFLEHRKNFTFGEAEAKFRAFFPVHVFNMDAPDYAEQLGGLTGTVVAFTHANIGVPMELAKLLSDTHRLLGSTEFKKCFDSAAKNHMLEVWSGQASVTLDHMDAPLF